jgi:hypothetical protein
MLRLACLSLLIAFPWSAARADDASAAYRIETSKLVKVKKGQAGQVRVEVVPRSDAHVSPDAPISLTVTAGPAVKLAKARLGRSDAKETKEKGVQFDVPFTAQSAGEEEVKGALSFFICTEKLCEKQNRQLALRVEVE